MLRNRGEYLLPNSGLALTIRPGKQVVFVTNNSTKSRAEYMKKLTGMGIPAKVVRRPSPPPPSPQLKNESPGRRLRLLLQRRSLHLAHPPPPAHKENSLRPRRKRYRNRTRQRIRPPHRRHRSLPSTHHRTKRLRSHRLRRSTRSVRWRRAMRFRFPYQLFENRVSIPLSAARRSVPRYEYGYHTTVCECIIPWSGDVCGAVGGDDGREAAD